MAEAALILAVTFVALVADALKVELFASAGLLSSGAP
jgi:hypothetical protein